MSVVDASWAVRDRRDSIGGQKGPVVHGVKARQGRRSFETAAPGRVLVRRADGVADRMVLGDIEGRPVELPLDYRRVIPGPEVQLRRVVDEGLDLSLISFIDQALPEGVAVDAMGNVYAGEVAGRNLNKFVKK